MMKTGKKANDVSKWSKVKSDVEEEKKKAMQVNSTSKAVQGNATAAVAAPVPAKK